jgi:hypothetical protein
MQRKIYGKAAELGLPVQDQLDGHLPVAGERQLLTQMGMGYANPTSQVW